MLTETLTLAVINNSTHECRAAKLVRDLSALGREHAFIYKMCSASKVSFIFHAICMPDMKWEIEINCTSWQCICFIRLYNNSVY